MTRIARNLRAYSRAVEGGMTLLGLYLFGAMIIIGVLAVDVSNLIAVRTQLQAAADFAAHAALYQRQFTDDPDEAKVLALQMVENVYPASHYGVMLRPEDLHFGYFNQSNMGFGFDESSTSAAVAFTGRNKVNGNSVAAYLSRIIGYDTWDVATSSVFVTGKNRCLRDGWVGEDVVDAQSNNNFVDGYCIHSNTEVQFNSNNTFQCDNDGTYPQNVTVTTPYGSDGVNLPSSGLDSNDGIECAIGGEGVTIPISILNSEGDLWLNKIYQELFDEVKDTKFHRDYLTLADKANPIVLTGNRFTSAELHQLMTDEGSTYFYYDSGCNGPNSKLTIDASVDTLRGLMIETTCRVVFTNSSKLADVTLWVHNTNEKSVTSAQDLTLGDNDNCAPEGGVNIVTYGGFEVPQGLQMFGSQILAKGPVQFSAGPLGQGGSIISASTIDGTSNGSAWGTCPNDQGEVFEAEQIMMAG